MQSAKTALLKAQKRYKETFDRRIRPQMTQQAIGVHVFVLRDLNVTKENRKNELAP